MFRSPFIVPCQLTVNLFTVLLPISYFVLCVGKSNKVMALCSTHVEVEVWRHIHLTPATDDVRYQIRAYVALF